MVRGVPCMCMMTSAAPERATTSPRRGSNRSAETSLTIVAPAASAASATTAFEVSMLTGTPERAASSRTTGTTRRNSSCAETGSAPGRVDSPPTSRMSAPSPARRRPCSIAAAGSKNVPPSEKESGVTLTIPMIAVRSPSSRTLRAEAQ